MIEVSTFLFTTGVTVGISSLVSALSDVQDRGGRKWPGVMVGGILVVIAFGFEPQITDVTAEISNVGGTRGYFTFETATVQLPNKFKAVGPIRWNFVPGSYKPKLSQQMNKGKPDDHVRCRDSAAAVDGETIRLSAIIENWSTGTKISCNIGGSVQLVRVFSINF